ncbi:hypothetical protein EXIGLDRAFT_304110 [Exidia glandulosa HHB12029]|uniref:Uncharacterized protein n=1 Tax=Exidia glandulosa HHB12029 TaxID=1314781 RepID=A0A165D5H8_EXIGL|nr:hypothetical protein EXIGLDRAFT_304110 [Exidia glandulosa HHB12029]
MIGCRVGRLVPVTAPRASGEAAAVAHDDRCARSQSYRSLTISTGTSKRRLFLQSRDVNLYTRRPRDCTPTRGSTELRDDDNERRARGSYCRTENVKMASILQSRNPSLCTRRPRDCTPTRPTYEDDDGERRARARNYTTRRTLGTRACGGVSTSHRGSRMSLEVLLLSSAYTAHTLGSTSVSMSTVLGRALPIRQSSTRSSRSRRSGARSVA